MSEPSANSENGLPMLVWRGIAALWLVVLILAVVTGEILLIVLSLLMLVLFGLQAVGRGPFAVSSRRSTSGG